MNMVKWTVHELVSAVAPDAADGTILIIIWMGRDAPAFTASRAGGQLDRVETQAVLQGQESAHVPFANEMRLDRDNDVAMLQVQQRGCRTAEPSFSIARRTAPGRGRARADEPAGNLREAIRSIAGQLI
jgi:phosphoribosyl-AMP cyclohydrolase